MSIASLNCPFCGVSIDLASQENSHQCPGCKAKLHSPVGQQNTGVFRLEKEQEESAQSDQSEDHLSRVSINSLGPYRIIRKIGEGGMGFVYEATDTRLHRRVALKTMESGKGIDETLVERFRREAQNAAKLRHPNIVPVHDVGRDGGFDYFTMDLVEGLTLDKWLLGMKPPLNSRIKIIEKVARALHYAHTQGVVHRDVKPGNIMVDSNGEPQIMDFGLARNTKDSSNLTLSGSIVGTPAYMAPEQTMGEARDIGAVTDVWALGVILYEILGEKPAFDNGNVYQTIYAVLHSEPEPLRKADKNLPEDLEVITLKCLEKSAARRYQTASAFADDLAAWLDGKPVSVRPATWWQKWMKKLKKRRALSMEEFMLEQEARQRAETEKLELQNRVANESKKEWKVIYEDNFTDPAIESRWEIVGGKWELKNGEFRMYGGTPQIAYLRTPITGDLRFEFECRQEGEILGDMSCFLSASVLKNRKKACTTGYLFQFGGAANAKSFIETPHSRFGERRDSVVANKQYQICAEKCGGRLKLSVDGVVLIDVEDPEPLTGVNRVSVGFYGWRSDSYFRSVKISRLGYPVKADVLELAETQLQLGKYEFAMELFEAVCASGEDPIRQQQAQKGLAQAKQGLAIAKSFPQYQDQIKAVVSDARVELGLGGLVVSMRKKNVSSLDFLKGFPILELDCATNQIENLEPLSAISSLEKLVVSDNNIVDLMPLRSLALKELTVSKNPISCLEALRNSNLALFHCNNTSVSDLRPLSSVRIQRLGIEGNCLEVLDGLEGLNFTWLGLRNNKIKNLNPLKGSRITRLDLQRNNVESLEPLAECSIDELYCYHNPLLSIKPLIKNPPHIFYYESDALPTSELEEASKVWKRKGLKLLATEAEVLLYLRHKDFARMKKLAMKVDNSLILFVPKFLTWVEAHELVKEMGGGLIVPNQQQNEIQILGLKPASIHAWVGAAKQVGSAELGGYLHSSLEVRYKAKRTSATFYVQWSL